MAGVAHFLLQLDCTSLQSNETTYEALYLPVYGQESILCPAAGAVGSCLYIISQFWSQARFCRQQLPSPASHSLQARETASSRIW